MRTYDTKAKIHFHDNTSGDGLVRLEDGSLVYFYLQSEKELPSGYSVEIELIQDTTFTQAIIRTSRIQGDLYDL